MSLTLEAMILGGKSEPNPSRVNLAAMRELLEDARRELSAKAPDQRMVTLRASARIEKDFHLVGRVGRFNLIADEPTPQGTGKGPSPLQYFLAGAAF